jgi:hypothetical protein
LKKKPEVAGSQIWAVRGLTDLDDTMFPHQKKKACTRAVEWAGALMQIRLSARPIIVDVTVSQYTTSVNGVSLPKY